MPLNPTLRLDPSLRPITQACTRALACLLASLCTAFTAHAAYPERPVSLVVGYAPGGTNDILARLISAKLQAKLKQPFIVENRAGANSMIAAEYVARAPADGYTLFVAPSGVLTINPAVYAKINYRPEDDFRPVALLSSFPLVVVAAPDVAAQSLQDLARIARQRTDQSLNHGVGASPFHLAAAYYAHQTGLELVHVNYRGTGPTIAALLANDLDIAFLDIAGATAQINAGNLKPLAVTTAQRAPQLPNVPTIAESGLPDYDIAIWTSLVVPKNTPDDVVATLQAALAEILTEPETVAQIAAFGMAPGNTDAAAMAQRIRNDLARWTQVAKDANIRAN